MIRNVFFLLAFALFTTGCIDENSPEIPCLSCDDDDGGPITPATKKVLIEEFTGVRCVNCPQGSAEIENLISIHGDRLVAISIHAGFFSEPYPESLFDFRTSDGDALEPFLGPLSFFPTAVVDRTLFDGEQAMVVGQASWSAYIAQQLDEIAPVTVGIMHDFDNSSRELSIDVSGTATSDMDHDIYLTVLITETNIEDVQLNQDGKEDDYKHKHVLREILTPFSGNNISATLNAGDTYAESFSFTMPSEWEFDNCSVIAFIHRNDTEKTILQVEEVHLSE